MDKILNWCFDVSNGRRGWGVMASATGAGTIATGLWAASTDGAGYAFTMNTFVHAAALVPLARYQPRYARAIGKWMLNAANAARLFYPDALPESHQTSAFWKGDPRARHRLRRLAQDVPAARARAPRAIRCIMGGRRAPTVGIYGSAYAGVFGGIVGRTNHEHILRLDCLGRRFLSRRLNADLAVFQPVRACGRH